MFPKALNNQVIVRPDVVNNRTESGLYISTDEKKARPSTGEVVSVSEDVCLYKTSHKAVCEGDRVMFVKNTGYEMEYEGETFMIIEDKHILVCF